MSFNYTIGHALKRYQGVNKDTPVVLNVADLYGNHTLISGASQQGKTRFEQIKMRAMVAAGKSVIMGDPKGNAAEGLDPAIVKRWIIGRNLTAPLTAFGAKLIGQLIGLTTDKQQQTLEDILSFAINRKLVMITLNDLSKALAEFRYADLPEKPHMATLKAVNASIESMRGTEFETIFSSVDTFDIGHLTSNNSVNMIINNPESDNTKIIMNQRLLCAALSLLFERMQSVKNSQALHTLLVIDEAQMLFYDSSKYAVAIQRLVADALLSLANRGYSLTLIVQSVDSIPKVLAAVTRNRVYFACDISGQAANSLKDQFQFTTWQANTTLAVRNCLKRECFIMIQTSEGYLNHKILVADS
jgi:type IV secretory pathway VirB4 component